MKKTLIIILLALMLTSCGSTAIITPWGMWEIGTSKTDIGGTNGK